jgi:osmoprotectant transport system permease protein
VDAGGGLVTFAVLGDFGDGISFIFTSRQSRGGAEVGGVHNLDLLWTHLQLTLASMGLAIVIALPIGLILGHLGRWSFLAISTSNVGRAVPSIALIAFFVAFFPQSPEFLTVTLALALLAIPPILTNAYVAIQQVDRELVDAARGMGLSGAQVLRQVELPLGLPLIFGGIKTSTVNVIATATIAPLANVQTLGEPIITPQTYGFVGQLGASILVAAITIAVDFLFARLQRAVTPAGLKLAQPAPRRWFSLPTRRRLES